MAAYCDACKQMDHWIKKTMDLNNNDYCFDRRLTFSAFSKLDPRKVFGKSLWGTARTFLGYINNQVYTYNKDRRVTFKVLPSWPGSPTTAIFCSSCQVFSKTVHLDYPKLYKITLKQYVGNTIWLEMRSHSVRYIYFDLCIVLPLDLSGSFGTHYRKIEDGATVHRCETFNKDFINLKLVRQWLDTCITRHDTCKLPVLLHLEERLYLIDVKYECIVQLFAPDIEYTALSYVWGNSNVTKATSSNIRDLMKPQALSKSSNIIIPSTIRDAMCLTKSLGKQYIWVDSLCILQDDPQLQGYLDQMAYIYANACVTIIMADGENADHGIKGLGQNGDQRQIPGFSIDLPSCSLITWETKLEQTTWASRGWTFQEGLFSNRAIYICGGFLSWKCGAGITSEVGALPFEKIKYLQRNIAIRRDYGKRKELFGDLVKEFNKKDFTYETDAAKAFSGFSTVISSIDNSCFFFGLPLGDFGRYLLWIPEEQLKRRESCQNSPLGFANVPTWSWLAWKGALIISLWDSERARFTINMIFDWKKRCRRCSRDLPGPDCCLCSDHVSSSPGADFEPIIDLHGWQAILAVRHNGSNKFLAYHITDQESSGDLLFNSKDHAEDCREHGSVLSPGHNPLYRFFAISEITAEGNNIFLLRIALRIFAEDPQWHRIVVALCISPIDGNAYGICERIGIAIFPQHVWDSFPKEEIDLTLG